MAPMTFVAVVLAAALALGALACGREAPHPSLGPLQTSVESLTGAPPCSRQISQELSPSYPLPALRDGALVYKVFFFGWEGNPRKGVKLHRAEGDAVFAPGGSVFLCQERSGTAAAFPDSPWQGSADDHARSQRRLYELTEVVAALYASGRPADQAGRQAVAEFSALLTELAPPAHAPDYLALSPDFWDWAGKNGGRAPAL